MPTRRTIHLTCDTGEAQAGPARQRERQLLAHVSLACIACGGHAGDEDSMNEACAAAHAAHVGIAAHPSYPDPVNFGRKPMQLSEQELNQTLRSQLTRFRSICEDLGAPVAAVKPHGVLYHAAATDARVARTLAEIVQNTLPNAAIIAPARAPTLAVYRDLGLSTITEAFADRVYEPDGSLRSRTHADATIADPSDAAEQARSIVVDHRVKTRAGSSIAIQADAVCVHSDTQNAVEIARAVRTALNAAGIAIGP